MDIWTWNAPGYGGSSGKAALANIARRAEQYWDAVTAKYQSVQPRVWLVGNSLGCATAVHVASRFGVEVDGMILRNPPPLVETFKRVARRYPLGRFADAVGDKKTVMMQNHGVTTLGETVAEAWDALYHLERAARQMVLAYSTGKELAVMGDNLAEETAAEWEQYRDAEFAHFAEMKRILDIEEPDYKD